MVTQQQRMLYGTPLCELLKLDKSIEEDATQLVEYLHAGSPGISPQYLISFSSASVILVLEIQRQDVAV